MESNSLVKQRQRTVQDGGIWQQRDGKYGKQFNKLALRNHSTVASRQY